MALTVTVSDETTRGEVTGELKLQLVSSRVTARELIEHRVEQEVREHNVHARRIFRGLVQPTDAERELNGYRLHGTRSIDAEVQKRRAVEAFEQNGFLLFVDDKQMTELDEPIVLEKGTRVSFLKLVPLVGG